MSKSKKGGFLSKIFGSKKQAMPVPGAKPSASVRSKLNDDLSSNLFKASKMTQNKMKKK